MEDCFVPIYVTSSDVRLEPNDSFSTISSMEGLRLRSISTQVSPISMHAFICRRHSASNDPYMDAMCCIVQSLRTYRNRIKTLNMLPFESCNNQVIFPLTFSINFLADGWLSAGQFCSLVVISIISKPKLYMSDWAEISPLYKYSGAMYPLDPLTSKVK